MKITIEYTNDCKKQVFVETGNVIGRVMVEINPTTLTKEQRELLLKHSTGSLEDRRLLFSSNEYTDDVMKIIEEREAWEIDAMKQKKAQVAERNKEVKASCSSPCARDGEFITVSIEEAYWYDYNNIFTRDLTAFQEKYEKLSDATREDILDMINNTDDVELREHIADAVISKRDEMRKTLAEQQERKKRQAREKLEEEFRIAKRTEKQIAWIEANGSKYLKNLLHEGMNWMPVFHHDYELEEANRIASTTDTYCFLYDEDDYKDNYEETFRVEEYELSKVILPESMMDIYLRMKAVEGFVSAKWVKIRYTYCGEEQWTKRFLVVKFETELDDYEVSVESK